MIAEAATAARGNAFQTVACFSQLTPEIKILQKAIKQLTVPLINAGPFHRTPLYDIVNLL